MILIMSVFFLVSPMRPSLSIEGKNVLMLIVDDLRPSIKAFGDTLAYSPNIDYLASTGIRFHHTYAQQALCGPSRNSFLTSRRPDTLHLYDVHNYWRKFVGNFTTLPQYFKENGYQTESMGKVFHPGVSSNFTDDYPLSWSSEPWHPPTEIYKNSPVCHSNEGWFADVICPVTLKQQPKQTLPDIELLQKASKFLKSRSENDKPFFLALGFHKPHIPFKFPRKYLEYHPLQNITLPAVHIAPGNLPTVAWSPWNDIRSRHDVQLTNITYPFQSLPDNLAKEIRQAYFASVTYIDDLIGRLLRILKAKSLDKNTIVVLLSDHGWSLGEHGEWSKYSNYDVSLKVPLIIRVPNLTFDPDQPGTGKTGLKSDELVELVDLFPTLVDLAGLDKIPQCQSKTELLCTEGNSLLPLILSKVDNGTGKKSIDWKKAVFSQYPRPGITPSLQPDSDQPKLHEIRIMGYSIRTPRHRYTEWVAWNYTTFEPDWSDVAGVELYDHHIDPEENMNLSGRPGLEVTELNLKKQLKLGFQSQHRSAK